MRSVIIIMDGVGIGEAPDASLYGDSGSATIQHIAARTEGIFLPNLWDLGLGNVAPVEGMPANPEPLGAYGKMVPRSPGKDSTTGHWELAGVILEKPFPLYPNGFPAEIIEEFEKKIERKVLWNRPASGTEIIRQLGEEHIKTGFPIVYTSADSVFQIAAHIDVVPLEKLYEWCKIAREILVGEHGVSRVIARPFAGVLPTFYRTADRKDFSLPPPEPTMLDIAKEKGYKVVGIGKILDLYAGKGLTEHIPAKDDAENLDETLKQVRKRYDGILMTNLVDFDMKFGHRRNATGFYQALREFDNVLGDILDALHHDDILFISADHGNDPAHSGTDHTREMVPILAYGEKVRAVPIGTRDTFADLAATVCEYLEVNPPKYGTSFLRNILE